MLNYPAAEVSLLGWYQILKQSDFQSEMSLYSTFGEISGFDYQYKFPVPDTSLVIHVLVNFATQVLFIKQIVPTKK